MATTPPPPPTPVDPSASAKPLPHLGDEFGTGRGNLPPAKIVAIALGIIFVVVGIYAFLNRPKSSASGSIDDLAVVEITGQDSVMVAVTVTIQSSPKTFYKMRSASVEVESSSGTHKDEPAPAVDFERYMAGFPTLKDHTTSPLQMVTIPAGGQLKGSLLVSFPVKLEEFNQRKSLKVTISGFGEPAPLVLTK